MVKDKYHFMFVKALVRSVKKIVLKSSIVKRCTNYQDVTLAHSGLHLETYYETAILDTHLFAGFERWSRLIHKVLFVLFQFNSNPSPCQTLSMR